VSQKKKKDAAKMCQVRKAKEWEELKKRRHQQSLDGLPLEESPSETVSGEDDDDDDDSDRDDDALSRYDATIGLADLPGVGASPCDRRGGGGDGQGGRRGGPLVRRGRLILDPIGGVDDAAPMSPGSVG
jgi:hypothetical protein